MKIDNSFSKRVAIARTVIGATQEQLANMVGIVRRQIAAYEAGTSKPREKVLQNLAAALGTTTEWLSHGEGQGPDVSNIKKTTTVREVPLFAHVHASDIGTETGSFTKADAIDFIPATEEASETAFAIIVAGSSMQSSAGISFPEGTIVTIDPRVPASSGDFVLCNTECDEMTFKQLIIEHDVPYLRPLNPQFPVIKPVDLHIIGVAIHAQTYVPYSNMSEKSHRILVKCNHTGNLNLVSQRLTVEPEKVETLERKLDFIINMLSNKKP